MEVLSIALADSKSFNKWLTIPLTDTMKHLFGASRGDSTVNETHLTSLEKQ